MEKSLSHRRLINLENHSDTFQVNKKLQIFIVYMMITTKEKKFAEVGVGTGKYLRRSEKHEQK